MRKLWEKAKDQNVEKYLDELQQESEERIEGFETDWEHFALTGNCTGIDCSVCPLNGTDECDASDDERSRALLEEVD